MNNDGQDPIDALERLIAETRGAMRHTREFLDRVAETDPGARSYISRLHASLERQLEYLIRRRRQLIDDADEGTT